MSFKVAQFVNLLLQYLYVRDNEGSDRRMEVGGQTEVMCQRETNRTKRVMM